MSGSVTVDTSKLERYARRLADGLETSGRATAQTAAERTATNIASQVPVLTGRLRASVQMVAVDDGYGVSYGQSVPYAQKIERRDHTVAAALEAAPDPYYRAQLQMAEQEARNA